MISRVFTHSSTNSLRLIIRISTALSELSKKFIQQPLRNLIELKQDGSRPKQNAQERSKDLSIEGIKEQFKQDDDFEVFFEAMTYQVIYPYNTTWDEEPFDYEEPEVIESTEDLAILPDLFTTSAPSASDLSASSSVRDMDTVEYLEQELMNIAPIRHVATLRGAELTQVMNEINNDQEEVTFNYLQTITDMESLDVMRQRKNECFNQDQILIEINRRLDELCTSDKIEQQVRKVWDSNPKASNRKRITPSERAAAVLQIKQDNRLAMRLRVTQERESAMLEKYGSLYRNVDEQSLYNDHF